MYRDWITEWTAPLAQMSQNLWTRDVFAKTELMSYTNTTISWIAYCYSTSWFHATVKATASFNEDGRYSLKSISRALAGAFAFFQAVSFLLNALALNECVSMGAYKPMGRPLRLDDPAWAIGPFLKASFVAPAFMAVCIQLFMAVFMYRQRSALRCPAYLPIMQITCATLLFGYTCYKIFLPHVFVGMQEQTVGSVIASIGDLGFLSEIIFGLPLLLPLAKNASEWFRTAYRLLFIAVTFGALLRRLPEILYVLDIIAADNAFWVWWRIVTFQIINTFYPYVILRAYWSAIDPKTELLEIPKETSLLQDVKCSGI